MFLWRAAAWFHANNAARAPMMQLVECMGGDGGAHDWQASAAVVSKVRSIETVLLILVVVRERLRERSKRGAVIRILKSVARELMDEEAALDSSESAERSQARAPAQALCQARRRQPRARKARRGRRIAADESPSALPGYCSVTPAPLGGFRDAVDSSEPGDDAGIGCPARGAMVRRLTLQDVVTPSTCSPVSGGGASARSPATGPSTRRQAQDPAARHIAALFSPRMVRGVASGTPRRSAAVAQRPGRGVPSPAAGLRADSPAPEDRRAPTTPARAQAVTPARGARWAPSTPAWASPSSVPGAAVTPIASWSPAAATPSPAPAPSTWAAGMAALAAMLQAQMDAEASGTARADGDAEAIVGTVSSRIDAEASGTGSDDDAQTSDAEPSSHGLAEREDDEAAEAAAADEPAAEPSLPAAGPSPPAADGPFDRGSPVARTPSPAAAASPGPALTFTVLSDDVAEPPAPSPAAPLTPLPIGAGVGSAGQSPPEAGVAAEAPSPAIAASLLSPSAAARVTSPRSRRKSAARSALQQTFINGQGADRRHSDCGVGCQTAGSEGGKPEAGPSLAAARSARRASESVVLRPPGGGACSLPALPELEEGSPFRGLAPSAAARLSFASTSSLQLPSPQSDAGLGVL